MKKLSYFVAALAVLSVPFHLCAAEKEAADRRPVVLLDQKDVVDRTKDASEAGSYGHKNKTQDMTTEVDRNMILDKVEGILTDIGIYRVVSKKSIERSIQEQELFAFLSGESNKEVPLKVPAYRMEVAILQYQATENEVTFQYKKRKRHEQTDVTRSAVVEIMFKIVDISTRESVLAEKFISEKSGKQSFKERSGRIGELQTSGKYLSDALEEVMGKFRESLRNLAPIHIVACTDDGVLTLDASSAMVKVGDVLKVFSLGTAVVSKRTGKTTRMETEVATIRVTAANEDTSTAEFVDIRTADCDWHVIVRRAKEEPKDASGTGGVRRRPYRP